MRRYCLAVGRDFDRLTGLGAVRPASHKAASWDTIAIAASFTAAEDPAQAQIIQQVLQPKQPVVFRLNPYRQNLHLSFKRF